MMQSNIVNSVFGSFTTIIKEKCRETPPKVIADSNGSSEETGVIQIIKTNTNLNVLHKSQNPNYILLYEAHKRNSKDWRFTDFDRSEGDFYLSGYRIDLKVASKPMGKEKEKGLPSFVAGSIPVTSLVDFPKGDGRSLYWCVSNDWSRQFLVDADDVLEFVSQNERYKTVLEAFRNDKAAGKPMNTKAFDYKDIFVTINQLPQTAYEELY